MNEDHKRRGFAYSKTLMTAAICALFLGGGSVMVHAADLQQFRNSSRPPTLPLQL